MPKQNRYDLSNRYAVITGGAGDIGLAIARRFAESGANVVLWDRDDHALERARKAIGPAAHTFNTDVADAVSVQEALENTLKVAKSVDILVNSAGITGPNTTLWEYPVEDWEKVIKINLTGTFLCCRAVVPVMRKHNYGRIVNIASIAGKEGNPNASAYSASKAAVIGLTKSLGKELAETGIRVNCITPAAVKTGMFSQMTQQHIDFMLSKIPMKRFGTIDEMASLVAWLSSEECSFSTGAVFDVSGGRATY
jgi:3-oxoacyl-[acyl-carrier protein] reductase